MNLAELNVKSIIQKNLENSMKPMLHEFFQKRMPHPEFSVESITYENLAFAENMVIMLLTNSQVRMFLKIHFHLDTARSLIAQRQKKTEKTITERMAVDFMKEMVNVLGGLLKRRIAHLKMEMGQSIPLDLEGYSEIFFHDVNWESQTLAFVVGHPGVQFHVSAQYEITGDEASRKLLGFTDEKKSEEEDIEFL